MTSDSKLNRTWKPCKCYVHKYIHYYIMFLFKLQAFFSISCIYVYFTQKSYFRRDGLHIPAKIRSVTHVNRNTRKHCKIPIERTALAAVHAKLCGNSKCSHGKRNNSAFVICVQIVNNAACPLKRERFCFILILSTQR